MISTWINQRAAGVNVVDGTAASFADARGQVGAVFLFVADGGGVYAFKAKAPKGDPLPHLWTLPCDPIPGGVLGVPNEPSRADEVADKLLEHALRLDKAEALLAYLDDSFLSVEVNGVSFYVWVIELDAGKVLRPHPQVHCVSSTGTRAAPFGPLSAAVLDHVARRRGLR